jgi:hypothetical protein
MLEHSIKLAAEPKLECVYNSVHMLVYDLVFFNTTR